MPEFDLYMYEGQAWDQPEITHETDSDTPVPMDFTGFEVRMFIEISPTITLTLSTLSGTLVFTSITGGRYRMNLPRTTVDAQPFDGAEQRWPYYVDYYDPLVSPEAPHLLHRGTVIGVPRLPL